MLSAFALALGQLADPRVLRLLAKSLAVTLAVLGALGGAAFVGFEWLLTSWGLGEDQPAILALVTVLAGVGALWLLWRIVALAVLQFFADEVVAAVEARHYPAQAVRARPLGWREELGKGLGGAGRVLLYNLLAVPVALALMVTGIGAPLVFYLVNAVLLGRELQDMVWLRHRAASDAAPPLGPGQRLALGGIVTALLSVPLVNLLAPFLGAAAATHLIHRKDPANAA